MEDLKRRHWRRGVTNTSRAEPAGRSLAAPVFRAMAAHGTQRRRPKGSRRHFCRRTDCPDAEPGGGDLHGVVLCGTTRRPIQPLQISVDGNAVGTPITPASANFAVSTSASFTVGAGSHTLQFATTSSSGDNSSFIDAVVINAGSGAQAAAITSGNATTFTVGQSGSFTVQASGIPTPSLSESGALPSGVTWIDNGNGTATLAGTPAANSSGVYPLVITATTG